MVAFWGPVYDAAGGSQTWSSGKRNFLMCLSSKTRLINQNEADMPMPLLPKLPVDDACAANKSIKWWNGLSIQSPIHFSEEM